MTNIYEKIAIVQSQVDKIRKEGELELGGKKTKFLAIDDILQEIKKHIVEQKIIIVPKLVEHGSDINKAQEDPSHVPQPDAESAKLALAKWGGRPAKQSIREKVVYDWVWIDTENPDSRETVRTSGESMDTQDKSTQKATTSAYKTMLIRTLMLQTGEPELENEQRQDDAEEQGPNRGQQLAQKAGGSKEAVQTPTSAPKAPDDDANAGSIPAEKKKIRELLAQDPKIEISQLKPLGNHVNSGEEYEVWFNKVSGLRKVTAALADPTKRAELIEFLATGEVK